jgi:ribosomal protein L37AE/L43A
MPLKDTDQVFTRQLAGKYTVVPPLECPECCCTNVNKTATHIICDDCKKKFHLKNGTVEKLKTHRKYKGENPRYSTGDYLE